MQEIWWIVVCNAARARVFETSAPGARMKEVEDWIDPAGRMRGRDLDSDRPGRGMDRARGGRHAMDPPTEVHDKAEASFARTVADRLAEAHQAGRFNRLCLIAAPHMLGTLRGALDSACAECCTFDWARDLSGHSPQDIASHLEQELAVRR